MTETVCIVDVDGTLANAAHRLHFIEQAEPNWAAFMEPELVAKDTPQPHAREGLNYLRANGYQLVFLTGRNQRHRHITEAWLNQYMDRQILDEPVYMRGDKENTHASVFKESQVLLFKNHYYQEKKFLFFEDDPFVARMFRKHGIVLKGPECWENMAYGMTEEEEPLWRH